MRQDRQPKGRNMNNKHFIIYYKTGTGTFVVTEPRPWSRENQQYFPHHDFNAVWAPTTEVINQFLIDQFNFIRQDYNDRNITVLFNLNPNINL